jgi:hypothetical protein
MKFLLAIICVALVSESEAQVRKNSRYNLGNKENPFLQQQWWIGLKGRILFFSSNGGSA